jgi:enoyl-CoA hydratase/2-(1,2-epoxy-1,2-dihydrophenyl)acetyl-CoA isomerase
VQADAVLELAGTRSVALLRLARPESRNAVRSATLDAIEAHLDALAGDEGVPVLVVAAEPPAFCAGIDLGEAAELAKAAHDVRRAFLERLQDLTRRLRALPQVTIAAVDGPAVGLGAELAIACDLRVLGPRARFQFPELARGLFPTNGVTELLTQIVGRDTAWRWLLAAQAVDAAEAGSARLGLVCRQPCEAAALDLAETLAAHPGGALREAVAVLRAAGQPSLETALRREAEAALRVASVLDEPRVVTQG